MLGGGREGRGRVYLYRISLTNRGRRSQREITNLLPCGFSVLATCIFAGEVLLLLGVAEIKLLGAASDQIKFFNTHVTRVW